MHRLLQVLLLVSVFLFFVSCNSQPEHKVKEGSLFGTSTGAEEIVFDVGYLANHKFVNLTKGRDGNELIYFADVLTNKCIKFFDLNSTAFVDSISLRCVFEDGESIDGISVVSLDTILVLSSMTNNLYYLNNEGVCTRKLALGELAGSEKDAYSFMASAYSPFYSKGAVYLHCSWSLENLPDSLDRLADATLEYYKQIRSSPYFAKISGIFEDKPAIQFAGYGLYEDVYKPNQAVLDLPYYSVYDDQIFVTSSFSNKVWLLESEKMEVHNSLSIASDKLNITFGSQPIELDPNNLAHLQEALNTANQEYTRLIRVFLDTSKKFIYIVGINRKATGAADDWFVFTYSTQTGQLIERVFLNDSIRLPGNMVFAEKKVLISNNRFDRANFDRTKARFYQYAI